MFDSIMAKSGSNKKFKESIESDPIDLNAARIRNSKNQSSLTPLIAYDPIDCVNATGGLHDYWFNVPGHPDFNFVNNVGTMLPAAAITYTGLLRGSLSVQLAVKNR